MGGSSFDLLQYSSTCSMFTFRDNNRGQLWHTDKSTLQMASGKSIAKRADKSPGTSDELHGNMHSMSSQISQKSQPGVIHPRMPQNQPLKWRSFALHSSFSTPSSIQGNHADLNNWEISALQHCSGTQSRTPKQTHQI